ncbi:hypothetical protein FBU30_005557 [Linnemannia zychae]|nr:hypothetical protein FBU30_005557 [Linnemannia zychae]
MARMYKFTHRAINLIKDDSDSSQISSSIVPAEITLPSLTMFSTILFMNEFEQMGMGDSVDVSKTCNVSEWYRRLYTGAVQNTRSDDEPYIDVLTLPPKPAFNSGVIYATTTRPANQDKEEFSSFLFAIHKPSIAQTIPTTKNGEVHKLPSEIETLVASRGVTHIWLCGSDPEQRRLRLMSRCLAQLEQDVGEWKTSGNGSGVITVHTIPRAFPGMVQFLTKNGFVGGGKIIGGEDGKVLYAKVL